MFRRDARQRRFLTQDIVNFIDRRTLHRSIHKPLLRSDFSEVSDP